MNRAIGIVLCLFLLISAAPLMAQQQTPPTLPPTGEGVVVTPPQPVLPTTLDEATFLSRLRSGLSGGMTDREISQVVSAYGPQIFGLIDENGDGQITEAELDDARGEAGGAAQGMGLIVNGGTITAMTYRETPDSNNSDANDPIGERVRSSVERDAIYSQVNNLFAGQ